MNETVKLGAQFESLTVRSCTAEDIPLINKFFDVMSPHTRSLFNRRDYNRRGVIKWCERNDDTRAYWICESDGEMVGYFFFLDYNKGVPQLGVAVRDDLCGKGIGKALVSMAIEKARTAGKGGIQLTTHVANLRAQVLYENMGFKLIGTCKNGTEFFYLLNF